MVAQHTQDEDTTTENSRSDDNSSNTSDADTEQTDAQSEHDIDEMKDAAATELYDIESATDGPHNGVERGRIVGFLRDEFGVSEDRAEEVIHTALMEGYCYEPSVSEETGDELLKPITKPITSDESNQPTDSGEASGTPNHEPAGEEVRGASKDTATIDLDTMQTLLKGNTSDTNTVKSIIEGVESGLLSDSKITLAELKSEIQDSQWDAELREVVLSTIETLREEREAQREFNRKIENGEIETNTEFPTPPEQEMQEGDGPPRPPVDPDAEPEPERDDTDPILDEYHDQYQPEFPGQMSGESIHLEDDDMEWREPRSLY